jgi:hypothetical protein
MSEENPEKESSAGEWTVRLDCGHAVAVPWGVAPPFVMALFVQHRETCSEERVHRFDELTWAPRLSAGVAFR